MSFVTGEGFLGKIFNKEIKKMKQLLLKKENMF